MNARLHVFPEVPLYALDTLWLQVAGTICNLTCKHCFISCSPQNDSHAMMTLAQVKLHLEEATRLGVKEYYFTGGEPFMNKEIMEMIEAALRQGPLSILTNGLLLRPDVARKLRALEESAEYALDLRVSLDGYDAATNDPIRGEGTFTRVLEGIHNLAAVGMNPVITVTEACEDAGTSQGRTRFLTFLRDIGLKKPRLKILPLLRLGAETRRGRGYAAWETLADRALERSELEGLQCSSSRMVTAKGVYVCPILLDHDSARMGDTIAASMRPFSLAHSACYTCHVQGLTCRT